LDCDQFKRDVAHLNNWQEPDSKINGAVSGVIVAMFSVGCIISSFPLISSYFLDTWGRRSTIMLAGTVFLVGCVLQSFTLSMSLFLVGRFVTGLSIGLLSLVVTLYQSEIAPPELRGALTTLYQCMITFGILVAAVLDLALVHRENGWRAAILVQLIPGVLLVVGMYFLPNSPRWLAQQNRKEEALEVLVGLRGEERASTELDEIVADLAETAKFGEPTWSEMFQGRISQLVTIGVALQMLQQLVGMDAFMYFGPRLFQSLELQPNVFQTICNSVTFFMTLPAVALADRCGRRSLLMASAAGMSVACLVMASLGHVYIHKDGDAWSSSNPVAGYFIASMVLFFVANFAYGFGPIVWVYCAEIFPLRYRSRAMGITTTSNWIGNYLIAQFFPILLESLGFGTFLVFAFFSLVSLLLSCWLPETKGVPLEQVKQLFDAKLGLERTAEGAKTRP